MSYELVAPPGLATALLQQPNSVAVSWDQYAAGDAAGHHVVGFKLYRSSSPSSQGALVADQSVLGPLNLSFADVNEPVFGRTAYYTLFSVEATDYGARPYGEGGNVPYGV